MTCIIMIANVYFQSVLYLLLGTLQMNLNQSSDKYFKEEHGYMNILDFCTNFMPKILLFKFGVLKDRSLFRIVYRPFAYCIRSKTILNTAYQDRDSTLIKRKFSQKVAGNNLTSVMFTFVYYEPFNFW